MKYSAFDRELLACFQAIRHFRFMLEGRQFTLFTDHKPLTTSLRRTTEPWTAKQCRQLVYISEFTSDIQHIAGTDNVVADTLSRLPRGATGGRLESPPRSTVRADRGEKDKIKLSTSLGGLRSSVEALPEVNAVRATTAAVDYAATKGRACSHSGQRLQHPCRWRSKWSAEWSSSATSPEGG